MAYQIAWDLPNADKVYDNIINATDLSVLYDTGMCPYMQSVPKWHICDLNNDTLVDSSDVSVILVNSFKQDVSFFDGWTNTSEFMWFGSVNYFD